MRQKTIRQKHHERDGGKNMKYNDHFDTKATNKKIRNHTLVTVNDLKRKKRQ